MKEEQNPLVATVFAALAARGYTRFPPAHSIASALNRKRTVDQILADILAWVARFPTADEAMSYGENAWTNYLMRPALGLPVFEPGSEPVRDRVSKTATRNEFVARARMYGTRDFEGAESPLGFKYSSTARLRALCAYMDVLIRGQNALPRNLARAALILQPEGEVLRTFHSSRGVAGKVLFKRPYDPSAGFDLLTAIGMDIVLGERVRGLFRFKNDAEGNITGIDPTLAMVPSPTEWEWASYCDTSSGAPESWTPIGLDAWVTREAAALGIPIADDIEFG